MKIINALALGAISSLVFSASAFAQAPAAAKPAVATGPAIAGVCLFSKERALIASAAGQSAVKRLKELAAQADAELQADGKTLQAEHAALEASQASIPKDQFDQRALTFNQHYEKFQQKQQLRGQEMEATKDKQFGKIYEQIQPLLEGAYTARNCGLLLNANEVYGANPAMDVTPLVVTALNGKLTSVTFERERLDQQGGQAQGYTAQPTSVAPAPAPRKHK